MTIVGEMMPPGRYDDGNGGHWLVGALLHLSCKHCLPRAPAIALLQDAMPRPGLPLVRTRCDATTQPSAIRRRALQIFSVAPQPALGNHGRDRHQKLVLLPQGQIHRVRTPTRLRCINCAIRYEPSTATVLDESFRSGP